MNNNFYSFLGLCQKAGKLVSGEMGVNTDIKEGRIKLLIIAEDTAYSKKNNYLKKAKKCKIPTILINDKNLLGKSIGKSSRALIGVKDNKMATNLIKIYENNKIGGEARV